MAKTDRLNFLLDRLIKDGERILKTTYCSNGTIDCIGDVEGLRGWASELILFRSLAGDLIRPWTKELQHDGVVIVTSHLQKPLIALKTIRFAIDQDLLTRFEDLVIADAFADLTEQAKYLLSQGYFLAAGVILRAVLEEKLRNLCKRHACLPPKANPTINDFNQALYTASSPVFDKTMMLHITALASVGNDTAHNKPTLKSENVERLARDLPDFLVKFST